MMIQGKDRQDAGRGEAKIKHRWVRLCYHFRNRADEWPTKTDVSRGNSQISNKCGYINGFSNDVGRKRCCSLDNTLSWTLAGERTLADIRHPILRGHWLRPMNNRSSREENLQAMRRKNKQHSCMKIAMSLAAKIRNQAEIGQKHKPQKPLKHS